MVTEPFGGPAELQQQQPPSILADAFTLLNHFLNKIHHTTGGPHSIFCFLHGSSPSLEIQSTLIY